MRSLIKDKTLKMKKKITLLLFLISYTVSFSQECDCTSNLSWAKKTFEENDAGFTFVIDKKGKDQYELHNKNYFEKAKESNELSKCTELIYNWMTFFRKGHIGIRLTQNNTSTASSEDKKTSNEEIIARFKDWEKYPYNENEFKKHLSKITKPTFEGIWVSEPYTIGVIKKNKEFIGFVIKADGVYWTEKQVKFKIFEEGNKNKSDFYYRDHSKITTDNVELIGNNHLQIGSVHFVRKNPEFKEDKYIEQHYASFKNNMPFLNRLDENTLYLRIPDFDHSQKKMIDSVLLANHSKIIKTKNLIIDVRNNGGGSDVSYRELIPYLYTNPIRIVSLEMYSTRLNNDRMKKFMNDPEWSAEDKQWAKDSFEKLEKRLGEFVNLEENAVGEKKLDTIYEYPKNVGIIINQGNGSTTEQFLLAAKQSKKVKLFGTTTSGILDISNMNFVPSPCGEFQLGYCLSKSLRIPEMAIDDKGIQPDYYIDKNISKYRWIEFVQNILNQ